MPSLAELEAFLLPADRDQYDLTAIRLANPESRRNQLNVAILKLNTSKTETERQWTLFYLLRLVGSLGEWGVFDGLLRYLDHGDHWVNGLDIDEYLREINYGTFAPRTVPLDWVELAKGRLAARWADVAEAAQHKAAPASHADDLPRPSKRRCAEVDQTTKKTLKKEPKERTRKDPKQEVKKDPIDKPKKEPKTRTMPTVPDTLWPAEMNDAYPKIIENAGTGFELPPIDSANFLTERGPFDWPEGDTKHWFDIVQEACANIKVLTLPLTYPELVAQAKRHNHKAQDKYTEEEVLKWEQVVRDWDAAAAELPQIKGNAILKTSDGEVVLYKLDNALTAGWEDPEVGAKFISHLTDSLETLRQEWKGPLPMPGPNDSRHHAFEEMRAKYGSDQVGVWHFAFWIATGQGKKGPCISSQCHGADVWRFEPATRFLESMAPWQQAAAMLFRLIEPGSAKRYKDHLESLSQRYRSLQTIRKSTRTTFLGLAIPFQVRVLPHKDNADDKEGWVAMSNLGSFSGGDLVCGSDAAPFRFEYRPGQFVLMKSALLRHGVMPFEGTRRALVLFSHEAVFAYGTPT